MFAHTQSISTRIWNMKNIMQNEIHKFAVCLLSSDLAVANSNCLDGFPLLRSKNWNITFPHRNKLGRIITEVTRGPWIKTPVKWYITISRPSRCHMRFKLTGSKPGPVLILKKWLSGRQKRFYCIDVLRDLMLPACALHCKRIVTIIIKMAVVIPYCMYVPPKNRKCGLYCAVEHAVADCADCIRFEKKESSMNSADWKNWKHFFIQ